MKKFIVLFLLCISLTARADEGMWLPSLIGETILADMQEKGLKLTADDIYSINQASLKDAIVRFGRGCTGELISNEGLLITNHHCGYGQIQSHSSVEHDYLTNGFWAKNRAEELPNQGLVVTFLVRMEDVTAQALQGVTENMTEAERVKKINENRAKIKQEATANTWYKADVESLYYGNQYFVFVYEQFDDVRLVGAPPSAIGKFGGDTDNWMWPRHTGDFSLFRIYADKDNKPAAYSTDNIPYRSKKSFVISSKGFDEGDFTFVYGFPARTSEYLFSEAVRYLAELSNPHKIKLRTIRLDIMKEEIAKDKAVRIKYSAKQAGVANAWKKWQGETLGIVRLKTVAKKQAFEAEFTKWAVGKPTYENIVPQFTELYGNLEKYAFARDYYMETVRAIELLRFAERFAVFTNSSNTTPIDKKIKTASEQTSAFFKDYHLPIDKKTFVALFTEYVTQMPDEFKPESLVNSLKKYKNNIAKWADDIYENSLFASQEKVEKLLQANDTKRKQMIEKDIAFQLYQSFEEMYKNLVEPQYNELSAQIELLYRNYMKGTMEMQPDRVFYPDANSTLRVAYGSIGGYTPFDGAYYKPVSTIEGIMEKDNPDIYDYDVPQRLRDLYAAKDFGRWAENGTIPVCFMATNHTTGGNSGSPVLNANGELIGINFDRTWESTMSDIEYDPTICRNIAIDIRYALFLIDKLAGASYLLDEMIIN